MILEEKGNFRQSEASEVRRLVSTEIWNRDSIRENRFAFAFCSTKSWDFVRHKAFKLLDDELTILERLEPLH